jgi:hypothetical protein
LISVNADGRGRRHLGSMGKAATDAWAAYIAHRLRAHARLCLQVAGESPCVRTAGDFARLADHCSRAANELASAALATESQRCH